MNQVTNMNVIDLVQNRRTVFLFRWRNSTTWEESITNKVSTYLHLFETSRIGGSEYYLENAWKEWPEIWHADLSCWPPPILIRFCYGLMVVLILVQFWLNKVRRCCVSIITLTMIGRNSHNHVTMMTSSNGKNFRVTGPLYGEFTGHRWSPRTKASDAELWCFLWSAPE